MGIRECLLEQSNIGLTTDRHSTAFNNCAVAIKIKYIIFIIFFVGEVLVFLFLCKMNMGGHHKFKYIFCMLYVISV